MTVEQIEQTELVRKLKLAGIEKRITSLDRKRAFMDGLSYLTQRHYLEFERDELQAALD
jgi:hypothetical protein